MKIRLNVTFDQSKKCIFSFKPLSSFFFLQVIFMAYDSDESQALELNELATLYDQVLTTAILNGSDQGSAAGQVERVKQMLDPTGKSIVSSEQFLKVGLEHEDLLDLLLPDPLVPIASWVDVFSAISVSPEMSDSTLDLFQLCQSNEPLDQSKMLVIFNSK